MKTKRQILEACIQDIDEGRWICSDLVKSEEGEKPMGCALGLVGINAGLTSSCTEKVFRHEDGSYVDRTFTYLEYPTDDRAGWAGNPTKVVELLAETVKLSKRCERQIITSLGPEAEDKLTLAQETVITYNDKPVLPKNRRISKRAARSWFVRALERLDQ